MKILISEVLGDVNKPNSVFTIGFWKADGNFTTKHDVTNRRTSLNDRKKMNRSGLLNCYDQKNDEFFDVTIDLIVTYNGMEIIRPEKNAS